MGVFLSCGKPKKKFKGMAASFPNINLTNSIKGLVSKKRNRYKKDGFNLDLTYITDNIIAMGYPASKIEGVYRNHIDDVVKFLDTKHKDHYYIYNLCSERSYDKTKFHNRVNVFPFDDHNPPKIESIEPFCNDVCNWLAGNDGNVAVVHCKAGKGRTGTMICCYLLHANKFETAEQALSYYGSKRTQDKKGVTIPSQVRYVQYYETMLRRNLTYKPVPMYIKEFQLSPPPNSASSGQYCVQVSISHQTCTQDGMPKCKKLRDDVHDIKKGTTGAVTIKLDYCLALTGDIKVEFYQKTKIREEKLFHFWFNTFFVAKRCERRPASSSDNGCGVDSCKSDELYELCLKKHQLDIVNKKDKQNKQFSADFKLTVRLQKIPCEEGAAGDVAVCPPPVFIKDRSGCGAGSTQCRPDVIGGGQDSPSDMSESSSSFSQEEDEWDSGETNLLQPSSSSGATHKRD